MPVSIAIQIFAFGGHPAQEMSFRLAESLASPFSSEAAFHVED